MKSVAAWMVLALFVLGCSKPPQAPPAENQSPTSNTGTDTIASPVSNAAEPSPAAGRKDESIGTKTDSEQSAGAPSTAMQSETTQVEDDRSDARQQDDHVQYQSNPIETKSDDATKNPPLASNSVQGSAEQSQSIQILDIWQRLGKNEIWVDFQNKQVIIGGYICLRDGALEMFACPANTKEHESVIATNAYASEMHAALLAIEAEPGSPSRWTEEGFIPPHGSIIDIQVRWFDEKTKQEVTRSAKEMVFNVVKDKTMETDWVFGGSITYHDPETNDKYYVADSGEMICLSNFSTAAIDIQIESTNTNEDLYYRAQTENIPELGTKVYLILKPGRVIKPQEGD